MPTASTSKRTPPHPVGSLALMLLLTADGPDDPEIEEYRVSLSEEKDRRLLFDLIRQGDWPSA